MKIGLVIGVLILGGSAPVNRSFSGLKADVNAAAEDEIRKLELELVPLVVNRDVKTYSPHVADDYVLVTPEGQFTKAQVMSRWEKADPNNRVVSLTPSEMSVRVYGDTAVMNFRVASQLLRDGKKISQMTRATKVFVRRGGRWIMINNQGTPIP